MKGIRLLLASFCFLVLTAGCEKSKGGAVPVISVTMDKVKMTVAKGCKGMMTAAVGPDNAADKSVTWSSSAPGVIRIDAATGGFEAMNAGQATITATSNDGGRTASCAVVVTQTLNILFIGNSFTEDAVQHLPGMVAAAGLDNVKMVHMNFGGRTMQEHAGGYPALDDYRCFRCAPGADGWTRDPEQYTVRDIVKEDQWSFISIQEHTGRSAAWEWTMEQKVTIQQYIGAMKADQAGLPEFVYIMSQAYGDPEILPSYGQVGVLTNNFASQADMYRTIASRGRKVLAETSVDKVIATGTTLQNLRTSRFNTPYDLTRDGYHMDLGLARYAASCTVFETVIASLSGDASLDTNGYRYASSSTADGSYCTPVTDGNAPAAVRAARNAVNKPFEVTPIGY